MRIVNLRIQIDDRPGVLGRIATLLGQHGANILEVSHRRMFLDVPAKGAELEIMIETRDGRHAEEIVRLIEAAGIRRACPRCAGRAGIPSKTVTSH